MTEELGERGFLHRLFRKEASGVDRPPQKTPQDLLPIFSALSEIPLRYTNKQEALNEITKLCRRAMGSHACTLALVDLENDVLTHGAGSGPNTEFEKAMSTREVRIGSGHSMDRDLIAKGKIVERYNLKKNGQGIASPKVAQQYNLTAGLCHPLKSNGHLLGYLNHFSETPERFSDEEKNLLKIFADQSVNVIERFDDYQRRERFSKILNELSIALLSLPAYDFFRQVCEKACELLEVPVCIVWILDEKKNLLEIKAATDNVNDAYKRLTLDLTHPKHIPHLQQGTLGYIENVAKPPHTYYYQHPDEARKRGWMSLLSAPMQANGCLIGMLDVYTRESRRFKSWEKELFATFANHTALSIQRSRWQERDLVAETMNTIDRIDEGENSATEKHGNELSWTLRRIAQKCVTATRTRMCHIRLLNRITNQLELKAYYDSAVPEHEMNKGNTIPLGKGIVGYVVTTGRPYFCTDTMNDTRYVRAHEGDQPISALFVPIKSGETVIGTLSVGREYVSDFGQGELQFLEGVEQYISLAIERAHLSDILLRLAASAAKAESLQSLLNQLVVLPCELMREAICLVWLLDKDQDKFVLKAFIGPEKQEKRLLGLSIPNSHTNFQQFLRRARPVYRADVSKVRDHPYRETAKALGWKSVLGVSLVVQDQPIGFLEVYSQGEVRHFSNWHRNLFKTFAAQAAVAIESVRNREKLEQLNETVSKMAAIREKDELLALLLDEGLKLVGCVRGWVSLFNYKTGKPYIAKEAGPQGRNPPELELGKGITGKALQKGEPLRVGNVRSPEWLNDYQEQWPDTKSELAIPIIVSATAVCSKRPDELGTRPIGVLNIESPTLEAFSQTDEKSLWALSRQAANVMNRIEFDRKRDRSAHFQKDVFAKRSQGEILRFAVKSIGEVLNFEYVAILLVRQEGGSLRLDDAVAVPHEWSEALKQIAESPLEGIIKDVICSGEIEVSLPGDERVSPPFVQQSGQDHLLRVYVPLVSAVDNRVIGVVAAGYREGFLRYIYEGDVQILREFTDYTARSLEYGERDLVEKTLHEFEAPIVGIRNNASLLQHRFAQLSEDFVQKKLDDIFVDSETVLSQTDDLYYVFGQGPPIRQKETTVVVRDIIIKAINQLIKPLARRKGLDPSKITYRREDVHKIYVNLDPRRINQVVYNLLTNAVKYASDDPTAFGVSVTVDVRNDHFLIRFADWGIGIPIGLEKRIFDRGFRAPQTIDLNITGSGLGLMISRTIMREMGGELFLSKHRQPTEFTLILPKEPKDTVYGAPTTTTDRPLR